MKEWRVSPEDGYGIQIYENGKWVDSWSLDNLPDWTWDNDDNIVIINRKWFDDNYVEIHKSLVEYHQTYPHLTFEGSSKIHIKDVTPEFKTMFTLRWK